jgi:hypothetical protein
MARKGRYGVYKAIILKNNGTHSYTLSANSGSYSLTGENVNFTVARTLSVTSGNYSLIGNVVNLLVSRILVADSGSYELVGNDVQFIYVPVPPPQPIPIERGGQHVGVGGSSWEEQEQIKHRILERDVEAISAVIQSFIFIICQN